MLSITSSLSIILRQYKEGNLSEDEAIQLIEDIYSKTNYIYPYYPQPAITWDTNIPDFKKFEVTCSL